MHVCMYACMHVCMYACICACNFGAYFVRSWTNEIHTINTFPKRIKQRRTLSGSFPPLCASSSSSSSSSRAATAHHQLIESSECHELTETPKYHRTVYIHRHAEQLHITNEWSPLNVTNSRKHLNITKLCIFIVMHSNYTSRTEWVLCMSRTQRGVWLSTRHLNISVHIRRHVLQLHVTNTMRLLYMCIFTVIRSNCTSPTNGVL